MSRTDNRPIWKFKIKNWFDLVSETRSARFKTADSWRDRTD